VAVAAAVVVVSD